MGVEPSAVYGTASQGSKRCRAGPHLRVLTCKRVKVLTGINSLVQAFQNVRSQQDALGRQTRLTLIVVPMTGLRRRYRERLLLSTSNSRRRDYRPRRRSIRGRSDMNGRLMPFLVESVLGTGEQADERCGEEEEQDGERRQDLFEQSQTAGGTGKGVTRVVGEVRLVIFRIDQQRRGFCNISSARFSVRTGQGPTLVCRRSCC